MSEYCKDILKISNKTAMYDVLISENIHYKHDFFEAYDLFLKHYKEKFHISEKKYDNQEVVIDILNQFTKKEILFIKRKPDDTLKILYKHICDKLKEIESILKHNKNMDCNAEIFEVVSNILILMTNSLKDEDKKIVSFSTSDIDFDMVYELFQRVHDLIDSKRKRKKLVLFHSTKSIDKTSDAIVLDNSAKKVFDSMGMIYTDKMKYSVQFYMYVLVATYVRNEEIKGDFGNVW